MENFKRKLVPSSTIETLMKYAIMRSLDNDQLEECVDLFFILLKYDYDFYDVVNYFANVRTLTYERM